MTFLEDTPIGTAWDWLVKHTPTLAIIIVAVVITVFITQYVMKLISRLKDVEKATNESAPKYSQLFESITHMASDISKILFYLKGKDSKLDTGLFKHHSPIELSDFGRKLLDISGGKEYVDKNLNLLLSAIESKNLMSALDVQIQCITVICEHNNDPDFKKIKDYIFQNPVYKFEDFEYPLSLSTANNIMGIYLRDKYFEKHPELRSTEPSFANPDDI